MLTLSIICCLGALPVIQILPDNARGVSQASIAVGNYFFRPDNVTVTTGTTVVWSYNPADGTDTHTVTSTNVTQAGPPIFGSTPLNPGQSFTFTFYNPGKYPYYCGFHPSLMRATIIVTGQPVTPPSNQAPTSNNPFPIIGVVGAMIAIVLVAVVMYLRRRKSKPSTPLSG